MSITTHALLLLSSFFFFFNDTATTEIYTLSLHDALPISNTGARTLGLTPCVWRARVRSCALGMASLIARAASRSEEHTSELQSQSNLVCRLLLEKKKKNTIAVTVASDNEASAENNNESET